MNFPIVCRRCDNEFKLVRIVIEPLLDDLRLVAQLFMLLTPGVREAVVRSGVAELGGLYILLAAGTKVLPEKFRITRFRFWMRSLLLVWWMVLFLGMFTYARWYVTWP